MRYIDQLRERGIKEWESRKPIERTVFVLAAITVLVSCYVLLIMAATDARDHLRRRMPQMHAQALRVEQQAAEFERLRNTPPAPSVQGDLRTLVQTQIDALGLSKSVVRMDATDADQIQLVLGDAAFSACLTLVENLRAQRVRLDASRVEAATAPGTVTFTATFTRPSST